MPLSSPTPLNTCRDSEMDNDRARSLRTSDSSAETRISSSDAVSPLSMPSLGSSPSARRRGAEPAERDAVAELPLTPRAGCRSLGVPVSLSSIRETPAGGASQVVRHTAASPVRGEGSCASWPRSGVGAGRGEAGFFDAPPKRGMMGAIRSGSPPRVSFIRPDDARRARLQPPAQQPRRRCRASA